MEPLQFADPPPAPLAERMRPTCLEEVVGQRILGDGGPLRALIERDRCRALLFWGPPGSGKTTVGRIIAARSRARFFHLSAALSSVREVRTILDTSRRRHRSEGVSDLLFLDELHRFNRAQQDVLLSHLEEGTVRFIGATTENPSFALTSALLSRCQLFRFATLGDDAVRQLIARAIEDPRGLDGAFEVTEQAQRALVGLSDGDARRALTALELAAAVAPSGIIDVALLERVMERKALRYDRAGDEHYNVISAFHKSVRNSDPDASLYWLARMLQGGEDPRFIARRLIRIASEDVGLADPKALTVAAAARSAVDWIGLPECDLALAEATVYMALAPKSNTLYVAMKAAQRDVEATPNEPVPPHLCNAPTGLMKGLGYGRGYQYAHDLPAGVAQMRCLPERLSRRRYYQPTSVGQERRFARRLAHLRTLRAEVSDAPLPSQGTVDPAAGEAAAA